MSTSTLDPVIQEAAQRAVQAWLLKVDHRRGWRGPIATLPATAGGDLDRQTLPTWSGKPDSGQNGQKESGDAPASGSSPQITHERVMGSLRSSITFTLRRKALRWEGACHGAW